MERSGSPVTGNTSPHPFMKVSDRLSPSGSTEWQLVRDPESELIYLSPRPDETEIDTYYPSAFYDPHLSITSTRTFRDKLYLAFRNTVLKTKASLIENSSHPLSFRSKIIEVGCSSGELLNMLRRRNDIPPENCLGFEKNRRSASHARKIFNLDVQTADFCDSSLSGAYDRIIFWHTLEHIHRINETLDKAAQCLGPNGAMVVTLPNAGSLDATLYGKHWTAWDAPRHLYHFTPATLGKLLNKHGLQITSMRPFTPDTFYNAIYSEKNILRENGGSGLMHLARGVMRGIQGMAAGVRNNELSSTLVYIVNRSRPAP